MNIGFGNTVPKSRLFAYNIRFHLSHFTIFEGGFASLRLGALLRLKPSRITHLIDFHCAPRCADFTQLHRYAVLFGAPKKIGVVSKTFGVAPRMFGVVPKMFLGLSPMSGVAPKTFRVVPKMFGDAPKILGVAPKMIGELSPYCFVHLELNVSTGAVVVYVPTPPA